MLSPRGGVNVTPIMDLKVQVWVVISMLYFTLTDL